MEQQDQSQLNQQNNQIPKVNPQPNIQPLDLNQVVSYHIHNGLDSPKILASNIVGANQITSSQITTALGYTPVANTPTAIETALGYTPENIANKVTTITGVSNTNYPSEEAVYNFVQGLVPNLSASANVLASTTATLSTTSTTPIKKVQVTMQYGGTVNVYLEGNTGGAGQTGTSQVYVNGIAVGTVNNYTSGGRQDTNTISGLNAGDLLQVYLSVSAGGTMSLRPVIDTYSFAVEGTINWDLTTY